MRRRILLARLALVFWHKRAKLNHFQKVDASFLFPLGASGWPVE